MNRKKAAKLKKATSINPYDDLENWCKSDFATPPWDEKRIADFQARIDSAFGAENAIKLIWNGDRNYGDQFFDGPWDVFGEPICNISKKPLVMFGQWPVNETDYIIISPARWVLAEVHHGSQIASDWSEAAYVADEAFIGVPLIHGTLETHAKPFITGAEPPCCRQMWQEHKKICYGKYRDPNDSDIERIRNIRVAMDRDGFAERNDTVRSAKAILNASLATKHFMKQAKYERARAAKELMLSNVGAFCGDILTRTGSTMSSVEMERIVTKALDQDEYERFSKE